MVSGLVPVRDEDCNLMIDVHGCLVICRNHFSQSISGESSSVNEKEESEAQIVASGIVIPLPDRNEVRIAISRLKSSKSAGADGLPAELFKASGEELEGCMQKLMRMLYGLDHISKVGTVGAMLPFRSPCVQIRVIPSFY